MKNFFVILAASAAFASQAFAQTQATTPAAAPKPSPSAAAPDAAATPKCKDGSAPVDQSTHGCRGHGGMMSNASSAKMASGATPAASTASKMAPVQMAPGGGDGKVWVNSASKVYHCEGDKYYGKTKKGEYMAEADAKAKGFHGEHGKACGK